MRSTPEPCCERELQDPWVTARRLTWYSATQEGAAALAVTQKQIDTGYASAIRRDRIERHAREDMVPAGQKITRSETVNLENRAA